MDLFELSGQRKYIDAVDGFWQMFRQHWLHVGGSVAIKVKLLLSLRGSLL